MARISKSALEYYLINRALSLPHVRSFYFLKRYMWVFVPAILCLFASCRQQKEKLFTSLSSHVSGITFENNINESDSFNILDYLYFYNGGGVAIGDINNDGLQDVYFSSNQGSNRLYLNKGIYILKTSLIRQK